MAQSINAGFSIDNFKANFKNGARGYMFYVKLTFPGGSSSGGVDPTFLVRSSSIPEKSVEPIEVPWQGSVLKIGGKTTFSDWTVTFTVDTNADIYNKFVAWSDMVHDPATNIHGVPEEYMQDQIVQLLNPQDPTQSIIEMKMIGAWPTSVGSLELSYDGADIATFDVTFTYVRHELTG